MRARNTFPFLLLAVLSGCYQSGDVLTQDSGVHVDAVAQDTARDAPPTVVTGDPLHCETAPLVPIDARVENIDATGALSPEEGSCWTPNRERRAVYYRVEVPAHRGIEVRTSSATDAPVVGFVDRCTEAVSRCIFFQNSNGDAGTAMSRRWYYGNPSDATQSLVIALHWFPTSAMTGGEPPGVFTLETESHALPSEATCETPLSLGADTLLPASTSRGGTYENWECIRRPEAHFVSITIPPRSQAIPLEGSQQLNLRLECGCTPGLPFVNQLNNFTDTPRQVTLERIPNMPFGVRYAALPTNATCDGASPLEIAANEASARPTTVATYAYGISEYRVDACSAYNDAVWYRVSIPAGRRVRVTSSVNSAYPLLAALMGACGTGADGETCTRAVYDGSALALDLENLSATTIERTLVVGSTGPDISPIVGTIRAFFVE